MSGLVQTVNHATKTRASITFDVDSIQEISDPALKTSKQALLGEIFALHKTYSEFLTRGRNGRIAFLEKRHADVVEEANKAWDALQKVRATGNLIQRAAVEADNAVSDARFKRRIAIESKPRPPLARKVEFEAWERKCAEAEKVLEDALKKQRNATLNHQGHQNSVAKAQAAFNELKNTEHAVRVEIAALTGKVLDEEAGSPTNQYGL
jgi:hypothetical protein